MTELELQILVSHHVCSGNQTLARVASAPSAESPSPSLSHSLTWLMVAANEQKSQFCCNQTAKSPF